MDADYQKISELKCVTAEKAFEEALSVYYDNFKNDLERTSFMQQFGEALIMKKNISMGLGFGEIAIMPVVKKKAS